MWYIKSKWHICLLIGIVDGLTHYLSVTSGNLDHLGQHSVKLWFGVWWNQAINMNQACWVLMKSLQCNFSENVLHYLGILQIYRDPFKLRSPNLDQRYKTTWLCISLSKSPHSNYTYVQFLPFNSLWLRDGWLFTDDIFKCIFRWKFLNLDRNLLTFIAKGPIEYWPQVNIGLDNGLVSNEWQITIRANVDITHSHRNVTLCLNE